MHLHPGSGGEDIYIYITVITHIICSYLFNSRFIVCVGQASLLLSCSVLCVEVDLYGFSLSGYLRDPFVRVSAEVSL